MSELGINGRLLEEEEYRQEIERCESENDHPRAAYLETEAALAAEIRRLRVTSFEGPLRTLQKIAKTLLRSEIRQEAEGCVVRVDPVSGLGREDVANEFLVTLERIAERPVRIEVRHV